MLFFQDAYHHRIMNLLSQDVPESMLPPPAQVPVGQTTPTSGKDLKQLRKEVHQLEIEYRVATQESKQYVKTIIIGVPNMYPCLIESTASFIPAIIVHL